MIEYDYEIIKDIEGHVDRMRDDFQTVMDLILAVEKKILAVDVNPYHDSYHFAAEGTKYYYEGVLDYVATTNLIHLSQQYDYGDGDYACTIERSIPYDVINGGPAAIEAHIYSEYNKRHDYNADVKAATDQAARAKEDEEKQKRFDQYLLLKTEFENV